MKLTPAQSEALTKAVEVAESYTSAEVVLVILPRSAAPWGYASVVGAVGAAVALALLLFLEELEVSPELALVGVALAGLAAVGLALSLPMRWLTPAGRLSKAVDDQAHAAFSRYGVYRTSGHTGILVFLSLAEAQARVLCDLGIERGVPARLRDEWRARFTALARDFDVAALAQAIESLGRETGSYLPRAEDDVNELSNAPQVGA